MTGVGELTLKLDWDIIGAIVDADYYCCIISVRKENFWASVRLLFKKSIVSLFFARVFIASSSLSLSSLMMFC